MKIQYASDLHLEFEENREFLAARPLKAAGDVLVLAGDICPLLAVSDMDFFWDWCEKNFQQVLIVPGNHEFFGTDLEDTKEPVIPIRDNVAYYYNKTVTIDDTDFFLTPLWSHVPPAAEAIVKAHMVDFRKIAKNGKRLTVKDYNALHDDALRYLKQSVESSRASKKVVVTHHLPSFAVVQPCYKTSPTTYGFAVELGDWIESRNDIDVWIYGHSHFNIKTILGHTKLLSNQLGYSMRPDEGKLVSDACFEL